MWMFLGLMGRGVTCTRGYCSFSGPDCTAGLADFNISRAPGLRDMVAMQDQPAACQHPPQQLKKQRKPPCA
jgi:hypothetical protein